MGQTLGPGVVGLNLDLYAGSVLGLVGPNGAGKTTLLRMMAGILPLQKGEVKARFHSDTPAEVDDLRQWVGHMPEQVRWQGRMTVRDILIQLAEMRNVDQTRIDGLLGLVGLRGRQDEALNNLSQGMRQRLSIAAALLGSPKAFAARRALQRIGPRGIASLHGSRATFGEQGSERGHFFSHGGSVGRLGGPNRPATPRTTPR